METTLYRYAWLCNQQLPQSALGSKSPLQAMKDWHKPKPQLFRKQPYDLPGCDNPAIVQIVECCREAIAAGAAPKHATAEVFKRFRISEKTLRCQSASNRAP
jgi:hypothetical protein